MIKRTALAVVVGALLSVGAVLGWAYLLGRVLGREPNTVL